jgi:hypothetical protein
MASQRRLTPPIRHAATSRNRRKALHLAKNIQDEAMHLHAQAVALLTNYQYLVDRACKLVNRLEAENRETGR